MYVLVQERLLYIAPIFISLLKFKIKEDFQGSFAGCCYCCNCFGYWVTLILCNGSSKFLYPVVSESLVNCVFSLLIWIVDLYPILNTEFVLVHINWRICRFLMLLDFLASLLERYQLVVIYWYGVESVTGLWMLDLSDGATINWYSG